MRRFDYVVATTASQLADAQRLRETVYVQEEMMVSPNDTEHLQNDDTDGSSATVHLLVYDGAEAVGTVRLRALARGAELATRRAPPSAPFALDGLPASARVAAAERLCVRKQFRGTGVMPALYRGLRRESRHHGISHWLAMGNAQTNCHRDASLAYRVAQSLQLVSTELHARDLSFRCPQSACSRHVYTTDQHERAQRGSLVGLPLPPVLSLFGKRMGAKYVGPPVFEPSFDVYAFPLVIELPDR